MATNFESNGTEWTAADQQALRVLYSPDFCQALDGRTIAIRRLNENRWLTGRGPGLRVQAWELGSVSEITEQQKFKVECNDDGSFALSTWYLGVKLYVARDTNQPADDHNVISTHIPSSNAKRWRAYRSKGQGRPRWGIELLSPNLGLKLNNDESVVLDDHSKSTLAVFEPR